MEIYHLGLCTHRQSFLHFDQSKISVFTSAWCKRKLFWLRLRYFIKQFEQSFLNHYDITWNIHFMKTVFVIFSYILLFDNWCWGVGLSGRREWCTDGFVVYSGTVGAVQEGSITRGTPASKISVESISSLRGSITQVSACTVISSMLNREEGWTSRALVSWYWS